jgi:hypothetical protein
MGRPAGYQWQPLGWTEDPVPGDPAEISKEAQHLAAVAAQIADQVSALRKIGADGTEVGEHADAIRSNAGDLATQLDKLVGRYQRVSSILNDWVPDLERAQSMSIQALDQAEGPYKQLNQTVALPSGSNLTPREQQEVQHYHNAMQQAQSQLDDAQALLNRAIALRDSSGASHANQINNACNDGLRDHESFWGAVFSPFTGAWHWVTKNWVNIVKDICTVLEVLATVLAIVAFVLAQFIPGVDAIVDALVLGGLMATGAAGVGRSLLWATGNGSLMDVAVDTFALLTFGGGRWAGKAVEAMLPEAEATAKSVLVSEMATQYGVEGTQSKVLLKMLAYMAERAPSMTKDPEELSGAVKTFWALGGSYGEEEMAAYKTLFALSTRFSEVEDITAAASRAKLLLGLSGAGAGAATGTAITATVLNGLEWDWGDQKWTYDPVSMHNWYFDTFEYPTGAPAGG